MRSVSVVLIALFLSVAAHAEPFKFFAFCMDTHDSMKRDLAQQALMLKEVGYDGAGHLWLDNLAERIKTLDAAGLDLNQVYIRLDLRNQEQPYDPRLAESLPMLKGRDTVICVIVSGMKPGAPEGRVAAVNSIRAIADLAAKNGLRVAIYPHVGDWCERIEQGLELLPSIQRDNVGVMFNLCHWLKTDGNEANLEPLLKKAMPRLYGVSIHGADTADDIRTRKGNWIQPLGRGSFDTCKLLRMLQGVGYRGPIGLQCYGIPGDAQLHLTESMRTWKTYMGALR
jgi:sugar phosphate isomerase/epimerase